MKCFSVLSFLVFMSLVSFSQEGVVPSINKDLVKEKELLEAVSNRYKKDIGSIKGEHKKYIAEIYKERLELIRERFNENEIVTDAKASAFLLSLASQIIKSNNLQEPSELRIVFSRSWWPNASSMGEGTILFNIGLFSRIENESQAIFILCHELAHYYLDHGNKNIEQYVTTLYSDAFQKQLKSIQKAGYRQNQQLESLAKNLTFRNRRHSREYEQAADSMAVELMKNTGYDLNEVISCLALLDSVDKDKFEGKLELSKRFDFTNYRFKSSWLVSDRLMFAAEKENKKETDSLKTHPDCSARIAMLKETVNKLNKPSNRKFIVNKEEFERLKQQFDIEVLNYCFENKKVARCLYYSLQMINKHPDNGFLHAMVGKCLNEIYIKQKAHQLGNIVDLPGPDYKEEYNQLLQLIQNLRLTEIAALSYYYLQQHQVYEKEKEFASALNTSRINFNN